MQHPENDPEYKGLVVNSGVAPVTTVNPYLNRKRFARKALSAQDYVEGILKGNVTILGQAVTLVESTLPHHQQIAQEVIEKCLPYAGNSVRIGISGVPGAGKSTRLKVTVNTKYLKKAKARPRVLLISDDPENAKKIINIHVTP